MKRFTYILCLNLLAFVAASAGTISIQPPATTLPLGSLLSLDVNVSGVSDLYAWQFDITFNPAVLSANNVTEGALFSSIGVFFSPGTIDNTAGTITFIGDSLSGPGPGISADGTLVQILFNSVNPGSSNVDLSNIILLDSNLGDITVNAVWGSVDVTGVPEPSYLPVLSVAFLVVVARLKRLAR